MTNNANQGMRRDRECAACHRPFEDGEPRFDISHNQQRQRFSRLYCQACAHPHEYWPRLIREKLRTSKSTETYALLLNPVLREFYGRPYPSGDEIQERKDAIKQSSKTLTRAKDRLDARGRMRVKRGNPAGVKHQMLALGGTIMRQDEQFHVLDAMQKSSVVRSPEKVKRAVISEASSNLFYFLTSGDCPERKDAARRKVAKIMHRILPSGLGVEDSDLGQRDPWHREWAVQWAKNHIADQYTAPVKPMMFTRDKPAVISVFIMDKTLDPSGRLVRVLVDNEHLPAGQHTIAWDGRDDKRRLLPATTTYIALITSASDEISFFYSPSAA